MMRLLLCVLFYEIVSVSEICAGGIAVSQSLDRFNITFEDSVDFDIILRWDGPPSAYHFTRPLNPAFDRLKMQRFTSSVSSEGAGNNEVTTKRFRYTLVPTSAGTAVIDPITISYVSWPDSVPGELVTESMSVQVAKPAPQEEQRAGNAVWFGIIASVIVLGTAGFIMTRKLRSRKPKEVVRMPVEQFLDSLTVLKQEAGGDLKKFQEGLYKILAEFLAAKYNIDADRFGDGELEDSLGSADLNDGQRRQICQWLVQARQDKFRPVVSAPGDTIRLETEIRQFFEKL